ncbi:hypothetical protein [Streptomyces sp. NPDC058683]|uniref:hypothetical protein n=1 Tax=Streptomyces sp. NPDC058683 TaxID=3346597 RepID=UPI00365847B2
MSIQTLLVVGDAVRNRPEYWLWYDQKVEAADAVDMEPEKARRRAANPTVKKEGFQCAEIFIPENLLIMIQMFGVSKVTDR